MRLFLFLILVLPIVSADSSAMGTIQLDPAKKRALETVIQASLGLNAATVEVLRLGNDGLRTFNIKFGRLSRPEFNFVKTYFRLPRNPAWPQVTYQPGREYQLTDFLLPKLQASVGKIGVGSENANWLKPLNGLESSELEIKANCWSAAYDILRSDASPLESIFYLNPDEDEVAAQLRNGQYSEEVALASLKPFDYVLYYTRLGSGKISLDHVAVYLGLGLAFEKTGPTELDYYEIVPLADVTSQRRKINEDLAEKFVVEFRRLKSSLPSQESIWSAKAKGRLNLEQLATIPPELRSQVVVERSSQGVDYFDRIRPVKIVKGLGGHYIYDPKDPLAKEFRTPVIVGRLVEADSGFTDAKLQHQACSLFGMVTVRVTEAEDDSFHVEDISHPEDGKCLGPDGDAVKKFWVPVRSVKTSS